MGASGDAVADVFVGSLFHSLMSQEKGAEKGSVPKMLGYPVYGATPLELLVYCDVNMTGVDFMKATNAVVLLSSLQTFPW